MVHAAIRCLSLRSLVIGALVATVVGGPLAPASGVVAQAPPATTCPAPGAPPASSAPGAAPASAAPGDMTEEGLTDLTKTALLEAIKSTGGEIVGPIDSLLLGPLVEYLTKPEETAFDAAFAKFTESTIKMSFPAYSLVIDGGRVIVGGTRYTVEQMYAAGREQQFEAIIFGRGVGGLLGSFQNPLADVNFFSIGAVANRGVTPASIGEKITSAQELRTLWFARYRNHLVNDLLFNANSVDDALRAAWPRMEGYWQAKRAAAGFERYRAELARRLGLAAQSIKTPPPSDSGFYQGDTINIDNFLPPTSGSSGLLRPTPRDFHVDIILDRTGKAVCGGSLNYQIDIPREVTPKDAFDELISVVDTLSFAATAPASGSFEALPTGIVGVATFTGQLTTRFERADERIFSSPLSDPANGANSALDTVTFSFIIDEAGQLVLCWPRPSFGSVEKPDPQMPREQCAAQAYAVLQPASGGPPPLT